MIDHLSGVVLQVYERCLVLSLGPLGCTVQVPVPGIYSVGQQITIYAAMVWNQEKGPSLYGFATHVDKNVFTLVTDCSGIGPKIGLSLLADLGAERFLRAIHDGDSKILSTVSGIGTKKAEHMIIALKDKVADFILSNAVASTLGVNKNFDTVAQALASLSYSKQEIQGAMHHLRKLYSQTEHSFDQLLRQALSFLTKQL